MVLHDEIDRRSIVAEGGGGCLLVQIVGERLHLSVRHGDDREPVRHVGVVLGFQSLKYLQEPAVGAECELLTIGSVDGGELARHGPGRGFDQIDLLDAAALAVRAMIADIGDGLAVRRPNRMIVVELRVGGQVRRDAACDVDHPQVLVRLGGEITVLVVLEVIAVDHDGLGRVPGAGVRCSHHQQDPLAVGRPREARNFAAAMGELTRLPAVPVQQPYLERGIGRARRQEGQIAAIGAESRLAGVLALGHGAGIRAIPVDLPHGTLGGIGCPVVGGHHIRHRAAVGRYLGFGHIQELVVVVRNERTLFGLQHRGVKAGRRQSQERQ